MININEIKAPIKDEMAAFESFFNATLKSKVPLLQTITNYILRRKGKQMRPMFVFLSARLFNQTTDATFCAAAYIELLHTATLIHDDVVDESFERRGFFSINALWKSKIAVLIGDYLLSKGLLLAIEREQFGLLKIVSEAVREMSEGELLQIEKARKLNITEEVYFEIIRKKTATLIAACTASGAKSAGAPDDKFQLMKQFGEYVGIAFQIRDDLFDYERVSVSGKPAGNDIKEKKMTLPLIHVLSNMNYTRKNKIFSMIKKHRNKSARIKQIIEIVRKNGGLEYANEKMEEYKIRAMEILQYFPDNPARESLRKLVEYTVKRKK
jgi:octaprenyl-diphosphate synthase